MAFVLPRGRGARSGIKGVVRRQLRGALDALDASSPNETEIHDARKSVKKARAIFRLVSSADSRLEKERRRLRTAAHGLSAMRDADVLTETLHKLHARYPRLATTRSVRSVERRLRAPLHTARRRAPKLVKTARRAIQQTRRESAALVRAAARPRTIRDGLVRGYERSRDVFRRLTPTSPASDFHRWRRRVKEHWYHVRLLEERHVLLRKRSRSLHRLEDALGDDHDLEILRLALLGTPGVDGDAAAAVVLGCIDEAQARLRKNALALGRHLFALRAKELDRIARESLERIGPNTPRRRR